MVFPICFLAVARAVVLCFALSALALGDTVAESALGLVFVCHVKVVVVEHQLNVLVSAEILGYPIPGKNELTFAAKPVLWVHSRIQRVLSVVHEENHKPAA